MTSVREGRYVLATAFAAADRNKEAIEQLDLALTEPGATPTAAELHTASGALHEAAGSTAQAFESYVKAVIDSPALADGATAALRLLDAGLEVAVVGETVADLKVALASTPAPAPASLALAGRLLHRAGDLDEAAGLLDRAIDGLNNSQTVVIDELIDVLLESGRPADARSAVEHHRSCSRDAQAWLLLEERRFDEALALSSGVSSDAADALIQAVRLLALVALDQAEQALADDNAAANTQVSDDVRFARLVAQLSTLNYQAARETGEELARAVGTKPIALVIRAQTLLESAGNDEYSEGYDAAGEYGTIEEARRSLHRVHRVTQARSGDSAVRVLRHRWLRVQQAVRADDQRFQYALAEAVVALDPDPVTRRAAVTGLRAERTTYLQDAAARELATQLLDPDLDSPAEQATAYTAAATAFDSRGLIERARQFAERTVEIESGLSARCDLADLAWRASYLQTVEEPTRLDWLGEALRLLVGDESLPADADSRPGYLRGLLLAQLGELTGDDRDWQALPYLLAASLASDSSYRWLNLSSALTGVGARIGALACADRSRTLKPDDANANVTYLIAEVNHLGDPELSAAALATCPADEANVPWLNSVKIVVAAANGQTDELRALVDEPQFTDPWARWAGVQAEALIGRTPSQEKLDELVADFDASDTDLDSLPEVLRFLGRLDEADAAISRAERAAKPLTARTIARLRAATALARNVSHEAETAWADLLATETSPFRLLEAINIDLRLLTMRMPAIESAAARLRTVAEDRLRALKKSPARPADDLVLADNPTTHAALTRQLLELATDEFAAHWMAVAERLDDLDADLAKEDREDFLLVTLRSATAAVAARVTQAVQPRILARELSQAEVAWWDGHIQRWSARLDANDRCAAHVALWWATQDDERKAELRAAIADEASGEVAARALASRFAALADDGDAPAAAEAYLSGSQFQATPPFAALAAEALGSVAAYPRLLAALTVADSAPQASPAAHDAAAATRDLLLRRLEELLDLDAKPYSAKLSLPRPVTVEVGADLVPLSDSLQDGNVFIGQLLPELRERVLAATGVLLPGVWMTRNDDLAQDQYRVKIDDDLVARGSIEVDGAYSVRAATATDLTVDGETANGAFLSRFHPLTGQDGAWAIEPLTDVTDGASADATPLSPQQLLIHAIERALRPSLASFFGPQETSELLARLRDTPAAELANAVVPDADASLALTWVLQAVIGAGMSITDLPAILGAVRDAGGLGEPVDVLLPAIGAGLSGGEPDVAPHVTVPADLTAAIREAAPRSRQFVIARHELAVWIRRAIAAHGPLLTLAVGDPAGMGVVGDIVRAESDLGRVVPWPADVPLAEAEGAS